MQTILQFFGKFPSLLMATIIVILIANLVFRTYMRMEGKDPSLELNGLGAFIYALGVGALFFLVSMFYGPFSFLAFK